MKKIVTIVLSLSFLFAQTSSDLKEDLKEEKKNLSEERHELKELSKLKHLESLKALESLKHLRSLEQLRNLDNYALKELEMNMKHLEKSLHNLEIEFNEKQLKELKEVLPELEEELEKLDFEKMNFHYDKKNFLKRIRKLDDIIDNFEDENKDIFDALEKQHPDYKEGEVEVELEDGRRYRVNRDGDSYRIKKLTKK